MSPSICVCFYFTLGGFSHSEQQKCHINNTFKKVHDTRSSVHNKIVQKQHFHSLIFTISVLVLSVPNDKAC